MNHNELLPKTQSSVSCLCSMMRNHLCLDWHTVYHIWIQRNASIHQGRLFFEEVVVKMNRWEVKNRVECSSYCNSV